jgi:hypothetical protein
MNKARALLSAIGASVALAVLLTGGCAKPAGTTAVTCSSGQTVCDQGCFNTSNDAQHCGSCDNVCSSGRSCVSGTCSCATGFSLCGSTCIALTSDHNNCGSCGTACSGTQVCNGSQCTTSCSGSATNCNGSCVDTTSSITNCGRCGMTCPSGICTNSACVTVGGGLGGTTGGGQGGVTGGGLGGVTGGGGLGGATGGGLGGATGSQGGFTGANPAGWWTAGTWHGCAWTGIDTVTKAPNRTTITPTDFTTLAAGSPYHVSGSVGQDPPITGVLNSGYGGVALLGFNLNQSPAGASCIYNPAAASAMGPPGVTFPAGPTGIAVNFSKTGGTGVVRIQIQGPNGATDQNDRWCYGLTAVQGKDFAPFSRFYTQCYADDGNGNAMAGQSLGMAYAGQPISAIVFLVPGTSNANLPYDITVNGFALGTSANDAPNGGTVGTLTGTIGGADSTNGMAIDLQRVKVAGSVPVVHSYIIQNNNWGAPLTTDQTISYANNSFKVTSVVGGDLAKGSVRSFPSIYVGSNGNTMGGAFSTSGDDHLPKLNSSIVSANTTFNWSGGTPGGNYNATYDVWFASQAPAATFPFYPEYQDGKSGFLMVWFYKPAGNGPIGTVRRTATILGKTFSVYSGPRATGPSPTAPVVSYVATTTINSWSFDLNAFIKDATLPANQAIDSAGSASGILASWYLTDVFAGFEIWNGQNAVGLSADAFTFDLK